MSLLNLVDDLESFSRILVRSFVGPCQSVLSLTSLRDKSRVVVRVRSYKYVNTASEEKDFMNALLNDEKCNGSAEKE